ncbi:ubiquinol-cytochrome c reductase complex assembly factor 6 sloth 2 [Calliopsis andreniformis]|uniref:ubiquinol-cytochrome c reductase complex assembly factor 6 sloth 2 n=1 Tax=Calliopsis andreniformis TaxID=337506 RepID=UPI003FCEA22D
MPYGVSWPRFIAFIIAATAISMVGSQTVHVIYKPLDDLEERIEAAVQMKLAEKNNTRNV